MFFSFLAVFPLPERYQNDPKFHFNTLLRSDAQKSSKKVENTTRGWSQCEIVFGPPAPPAKADIATAILTNVIEHLVLLLPPNKHAFTAKAVWADFHFHPVSIHFSSFFLFCINVYPISSTVIHYSSIFHSFFIHFHPFFMFRHRCSSIFALVMLSSIYNPVILTSSISESFVTAHFHVTNLGAPLSSIHPCDNS